MPSPQVAVIIGAGDATGGAIARRFAREGLTLCVTRRQQAALEPLTDEIRKAGGVVHPFGCDAREEAQMAELFDHIERDIGEIAVVVFNIGANVRFSITETTTRVYRKVWEMAAMSGFLTGREAARVMLPRGRGTIIFTGATASLRGSSGFSAFSGAKFALRALAQSMARELGPQGIHVAHPIIDGAIDTDFIRDNFPERYALKDQDGILNPEHIAEQYWQLHCQPRDSWTHELDLRPWLETF
ncbi:short-chain dehydrogenase [Halomonas cupida]|uniref:Short-chain dehydrogenase n=1 Tax=Halomonas cupida TaxID=44933 RepID=A0A1M7KBU9_9GAMM|nr:SDR family oxidoreductase [Halomonas cupida]GEN24934.1 short-chain dehydrogenase [Halomonas cupida]SHM62641.1 Short-chain dehydrogenase [Halomonas cupida]